MRRFEKIKPNEKMFRAQWEWVVWRALEPAYPACGRQAQAGETLLSKLVRKVAGITLAYCEDRFPLANRSQF
jgi:hypothetical protein